MVTLHDEIKTIQNGVFMFFQKRTKLISFQKKQKFRIKKDRRVVFLKNNGFFSTLTFQSFFVIFH